MEKYGVKEIMHSIIRMKVQTAAPDIEPEDSGTSCLFARRNYFRLAKLCGGKDYIL